MRGAKTGWLGFASCDLCFRSGQAFLAFKADSGASHAVCDVIAIDFESFRNSANPMPRRFVNNVCFAHSSLLFVLSFRQDDMQRALAPPVGRQLFCAD